ncbi:hypothetical protein ACW23B_18465 [Streptomyces albidoflavus]
MGALQDDPGAVVDLGDVPGVAGDLDGVAGGQVVVLDEGPGRRC